MSGGVSSFPMDGRIENELFRLADHALYRAKASGRKRVRLAYEINMVPETTHYTHMQMGRFLKMAKEMDLMKPIFCALQSMIFSPNMG